MILVVPRCVVIGILTFTISAAAALAPPNLSRRGILSKRQLMLRGGDRTSEQLTKTSENEDASSLSGYRDDALPFAASENGVKSAAMSIPKLQMLATFSKSVSSLYSEQLVKAPIITKSLTSGVIFGLSDILAQRIERGTSLDKTDTKGTPSTYNWTRAIASTLVGLLYFGPAAHYWYETIFTLLPGTSLLSTLQKAFWGQAIFGPAFTCVFFATSLLQSGSFTLGNWFGKIRSDLPGAWLAGAGYWPIVDLISYSIVPIQWIPLFVNMCSLVWTVYLSIVANRNSRNYE